MKELKLTIKINLTKSSLTNKINLTAGDCRRNFCIEFIPRLINVLFPEPNKSQKILVAKKRIYFDTMPR